MGVFTEGRITACFDEIEKAKEFIIIVENFEDYLEGYLGNKDFSVSIDEVTIDKDDMIVYVNLSSGRYPNAQWQCDQIFEMGKRKYKENMYEFSADLICPENIICWTNGDDDYEE
jgi:hypothetical protein